MTDPNLLRALMEATPPEHLEAMRASFERLPKVLRDLRTMAQRPNTDPQLHMDLLQALAPSTYRGLEDFAPLCAGCGACCDFISHNPVLFSHLYISPDNPTCRHLTPEGRCSIYTTRPLPCRVDATYDAVQPSCTRERYYAQQRAMCVLMRFMKKQGMRWLPAPERG